MPLAAQHSPRLIPYRTASGWGYSDTAGIIRIKPQFRHAGLFYGGRALVSIRDGEQCILDTAGRFIIPPEYHWNGRIQPDMRYASLNVHDSDGRYGVVDLQGRLRIPFSYEIGRGYYASAHPYFESRSNRDTWFMFVSRNGKHGVIDTLNREIIALDYDQIIGPPPYDSLYGWVVRRGPLWGALRPDGSSLLPLQYDTVAPFYTRGLFVVRYNGKAGIIDSLGNWKTPADYEEIRADRNWDNDLLWKSGFLLIRGRSRGWAAVDGREVIPPEYGYVQSEENTPYLNAYISRGVKTVSTLFDTGGHRLAGPYQGDFWFSNDTVFLRRSKQISGGRSRLRIYRLDTSTRRLVFQRKIILPKMRGIPERDYFPEEPVPFGDAYFDSAGVKLYSFYADGKKWLLERLIDRESRQNSARHLAVVADYRGMYAIADSQRRFLIRPQARFNILGGVYSENWLVIKSDSGFAIADTMLRLLTAHSNRYPSRYFQLRGKGYTVSRAHPGEPMAVTGYYSNDCPLCDCTHLYDADGVLVKGLEAYCFPYHTDSAGIANPIHPAGVFSVIDTGMRRGIVRFDGTILYPELSFRYRYMRVLTPSLIIVGDNADNNLRLVNARGLSLTGNRSVRYVVPARHDNVLVPGSSRSVEDPALLILTYLNGTNRNEDVYIDRNGRVYADPEIFKN